MKKMWNNFPMDAAGENNPGGGGVGNGGTNSFITTPGEGGKAAAKADGTNTVPGNKGAGDSVSDNSPKGNASSDWKASLPKELQEDATLKKFTSVDALAGAYINAQKLIGADKIPVPGKHTTDAEWKEVFKKLGLPEKQEEYAIKFKDGVPIDENFSKAFKEQAYSLGILPKQAQAMAEWFSDSVAQSTAKVEQITVEQFNQNKAALQKEWGNAFDLNINRANKVVAELGGNELATMLNETGAGANPVVMKFLAKIGETIFKEHEFVEGQSQSSALSPKELDAKIAKLRNEPAYYDKAHPQHKAVTEEITELYRLRYDK